MLKRFLPAAAFALSATLCAWAADIREIPFVPMSPQVMGRGGSFVAEAHGYDSFFFNPAGFSRDEGSFTLTSTSAWIYSRPDALVPLGGQLLAGTLSPTAQLDFMSSQVTAGGLGAGSAAGIGYVGNGLGLGAVFIVDSLVSGPSLLGLSGNLTGTLGFIGGLSFPFDLGGMTLHLGGAVRPMVRIHVPLSNATALGMFSALATGGDVVAAMNSADALYGVGIGLDLGVILETGWFAFGLSIRDLGGTQFRYSQSSFGTLGSTFGSQMQFPTGTQVTGDRYAIPMDIGFGIALHPDFGTFNAVLDPSLNVDITDIVGAFSGTSSVWTLLHAGVQVRFFSAFSVSAGINQGYLTVGAGLKLFFLDINAAIFTRELGAYLGDQASSGATLDLSIRW